KTSAFPLARSTSRRRRPSAWGSRAAAKASPRRPSRSSSRPRHGRYKRGAMYTPPYNRVEDRAEILAFMRANAFPLLVTGTGGELHASHLPVLVSERDGGIVLEMHTA